ncbi:GerAB/ArcD/ProY family transporter [Alkalihalobacillus deserti]|uniref:GerAB/ArcD/ProY family transporter n=1 Tax=Alkalihalobacillus deserti TaxID=2879466 RepID=UPI001D145538|nr:endospore germination permease [Alkalihalobacillus deserti]
MIEKGKISARQMAIVMYLTMLATSILFAPAITNREAGRDMWISPIWSSIVLFLMLYVVMKLYQLYPKGSIIEQGKLIFGSVLGRVLTLPILLHFFHANSLITWSYGEFLSATVLPQTPLVVIIGGMVFLCGFAINGGLEVLTRVGEVVIPIFLVFIIVMIILLLPDIDVMQMQPIFGKGIVPSIKGAIPLLTWFSQFFVLSFLLPFISDQKNSKKWGVISIVMITMTMVATNFIVLLVFGNVVDSFTFPLMSVVRYIAVADFLSHLESIVMAIWVASAFMKIGIFYYVVVLGTAEWLNLSDYRLLVWPIGFLLVVLTIWQVPNVTEYYAYIESSEPFLSLIFNTLIPMFFLFVAYILSKRNRKETEG